MFPGGRPPALGNQQRPVKQAFAKGVRWVKAHPLVAKAVPTAIGFCFGDVLTQAAQQRGKKSFRLDVKKTAAMLVVGATLAGPIGLGILQLPGSEPSMIGLKVLAGEVVGCVIWQAAYICISSEYRAGALNLLKGIQDFADGQQATCRKCLQGVMPST